VVLLSVVGVALTRSGERIAEQRNGQPGF